MLIRNINIRAGMCNGTRFQVINCGRNLIEAAFISGPRKGQTVFIPRIDLIPNDNCMFYVSNNLIFHLALSFKLRRTQFPVKVAFCMTISKSQGQSLECVGIDLEDEAFGHGMLYVAFSRCTTKAGIKVYTKDGTPKAKNVVDHRVLS